MDIKDSAGKHEPISIIFQSLERMSDRQEKTSETLFGKIDDINKTLGDIGKSMEKISVKTYEMEKDIIALQSKIGEFENYMYNDGCPAHKHHAHSTKMDNQQWVASIGSLGDRLWKIEERLVEIEQAPYNMIKTVANRVLLVFGTALGGWLLYKFGFDLDAIKDK